MSLHKHYVIRTAHFPVSLRFWVLALDSEFRNLKSEIGNYWPGMSPATTNTVRTSLPVLVSS
jgi:hypothetical protein